MKKRIGQYISEGIKPKLKRPAVLSKNGEYDMILCEHVFYETSMPNSLIPKIGTSKPPKKKYTYSQLIDMGYIP